jgi:hypothetical protein
MLAAVGATLREGTVGVPEPVSATVAHFSDGDVVMLPASHALVSGRRIVGVTLRVSDVGITRAILNGAVGAPRWAARSKSVFVRPDRTIGCWIEFSEE